ncbi:hypothetical protein SK128_009836, partial [Halocaridina rubra]
MFFAEASRYADLSFHLKGTEEVSILLLALERMKYICLWPRYFADMQELKTNHPATWRELENGNVSLTK